MSKAGKGIALSKHSQLHSIQINKILVLILDCSLKTSGFGVFHMIVLCYRDPLTGAIMQH